MREEGVGIASALIKQKGERKIRWEDPNLV